MIIKTIEWETIQPIWQTELWPDRISAIETHSAMTWPYGTQQADIEYSIFDYDVKFVGAYDGDKLVAVNSGHLTDPNEYRSRGLWVDPVYRGRGIAQSMFSVLENHAFNQGAMLMWSLPRISALKCYQRYGFDSVGEAISTETSELNIYARKFI